MKARLRVLSGKSTGKEMKLKEGQFLIGRSDSCHLRPRSDAVSRKHCILFIEDAQIRVRDLKSRNGTLVNGEKIAGDVTLSSGDKLNVGPLQFEVLFSSEKDSASEAVETPTKPVPSSPPTSSNGASPTPARRPNTATQTKSKAKAASADSKAVGDDDISSWLEEADEVDREERLTDPSTRMFKIGEGEVAPEGEAGKETVDIAKPNAKGGDTAVEKKKKEKKEKKEPGKLPPVPDASPENSQDAAADALRQFFKRS